MNFDTNVNTLERASRLALSAALIGSVLTTPASAPVVLALVALYPAVTALMAWDPVYAMFTRHDSGAQRSNKKRISMNGKVTA